MLLIPDITLIAAVIAPIQKVTVAIVAVALPSHATTAQRGGMNTAAIPVTIESASKSPVTTPEI